MKDEITIKVSAEIAGDLELACRFLYTACTNATAENPAGISAFSEKNMKTLGMTEKRVKKIAATGMAIRGGLNEFKKSLKN